MSKPKVKQKPSEWVEKFMDTKLISWQAKELNRLNSEIDRGEILATYRHDKDKVYLSICLKLYRKALLNNVELTYCFKNFPTDLYAKIMQEQERIESDIGELDKLIVELKQDYKSLVSTYQGELQEIYTSGDMILGRIKVLKKLKERELKCLTY